MVTVSLDGNRRRHRHSQLRQRRSTAPGCHHRRTELSTLRCQLARAEAIKRNRRRRAVPQQRLASVAPAAARLGTNWLVFVDENGNGTLDVRRRNRQGRRHRLEPLVLRASASPLLACSHHGSLSAQRHGAWRRMATRLLNAGAGCVRAFGAGQPATTYATCTSTFGGRTSRAQPRCTAGDCSTRRRSDS